MFICVHTNDCVSSLTFRILDVFVYLCDIFYGAFLVIVEIGIPSPRLLGKKLPGNDLKIHTVYEVE